MVSVGGLLNLGLNAAKHFAIFWKRYRVRRYYRIIRLSVFYSKLILPQHWVKPIFKLFKIHGAWLLFIERWIDRILLICFSLQLGRRLSALGIIIGASLALISNDFGYVFGDLLHCLQIVAVLHLWLLYCGFRDPLSRSMIVILLLNKLILQWSSISRVEMTSRLFSNECRHIKSCAVWALMQRLACPAVKLGLHLRL